MAHAYPHPINLAADQTEPNSDLARLRDWNVLIEAGIADFDSEVAATGMNWSLADSQTYPQLLALRELREELLAAMGDDPSYLTYGLNLVGNPEHLRKLRRDPIVSAQIADRMTSMAFVQNAALERGNRFTGPFAPGTGRSGNLDGSELPAGSFLLTFDDGPHPKHTDRIASELAKYSIQATFFWLAKNVKAYPTIVHRMEDAGHSPQNHSFTHANLARASAFTLGREISLSTAVESEIYKVKPKYFRCPFGAGSNKSRVRGLIAKENLIHVFWNVDSLDWADHNVDRVASRVLKQMKRVGGGIILMHDIHAHTPNVLAKVLAASKGQINWLSL